MLRYVCPKCGDKINIISNGDGPVACYAPMCFQCLVPMVEKKHIKKPHPPKKKKSTKIPRGLLTVKRKPPVW